MRRIVSDVAAYVRELTSAAWAGWSRFWFTPTDPTALGLVRLLVGLLLLRSLWVIGHDLQGFLGSHAWADPAAVREQFAAQMPGAWSFWLLVPDGWLLPTWMACLAILAMFAAGLGSRVTAVLAWVIAVSTARRAPVILYGFDQMVGTWALYLAVCGASGQALSLDRFLSRWRAHRQALRTAPRDGKWTPTPGRPEPSVAAGIGLRLIQLHLVLIYGMAGLAKLRGEAWWNGNAIWGVLAAGEFRRFDLTGLAAYPLLLNFLTHSGLAFELLYPALIWVKRLRPLLLATAVVLHAGIDIALGLTEFALAMIAANAAFVSGAWLRSLVAGKAASQPAGTVLYDGACPRCRGSLAWLVAMDPDRVLDPVDLNHADLKAIDGRLTRAACLEAMHLARRDGRIVAGFDAFGQIARWLPLLWPLGVLAAIPGVAWVGRPAYNALARGRRRDGVCTDATCALPQERAADVAARGRDRQQDPARRG